MECEREDSAFMLVALIARALPPALEIYMEKIRDLLAPAHDNLSIHEDKTRGVYVKGLTDVYVGTEAEVYAVMKAGGKARAISATNMNAESLSSWMDRLSCAGASKSRIFSM
jgi:RIO-like serine/threonine protein kinase